MRVLSEYHVAMRRRIPLSILFLGLLAVPALLVSTGYAQINGVPSSVTSPGFGGRPVNGTPPSVSSLGPRGFAPNPQITFSAPVHPSRSVDGHRHHRQGDRGASLLYAYPYPVPYAIDKGPEEYSEPPDTDNDPNYQGGPTVFDRRGSGERSYIPPMKDAPAPHSTEPADASESDPQPGDPTLLVFKDGRKLEVGNYAIVGATLFDLTPGHPRKVALAELDLEATRKQNDDRGIVFQLPPSLRAN